MYKRQVGQGERGAAGGCVGQFGRLYGGVLDEDVARVDEDSVLVGGVEREGHPGAGGHGQFGSEQRGEGRHGGRVTREGAEEDACLAAVHGHRVRHVVLEGRLGGAVLPGQRDPQLHPVQDRGVRGRDLRVADAVSAGHEVQLTGPHPGVGAQAVAVLDLSAEQPAHRLQSGVRVGGDVHAAGPGDVVGAIVVGEAPGADEGPGPLRQGAPHPHRARAAERHVTRGEDLDVGRALRLRIAAARQLGRSCLGVAHGARPPG